MCVTVCCQKYLLEYAIVPCVTHLVKWFLTLSARFEAINTAPAKKKVGGYTGDKRARKAEEESERAKLADAELRTFCDEVSELSQSWCDLQHRASSI